MSHITWHDFEQVALHAGTITQVEPFPEARKPAYKLTIDFGAEIGIRRSSAQITHHYQMDDLIGKQILAVVNFAPKQIGSFMSQCLVTGYYQDDDSVVLVSPDLPVPNGAKLA